MGWPHLRSAKFAATTALNVMNAIRLAGRGRFTLNRARHLAPVAAPTIGQVFEMVGRTGFEPVTFPCQGILECLSPSDCVEWGR
jgi:hypothetical protein